MQKLKFKIQKYLICLTLLAVLLPLTISAAELRINSPSPEFSINQQFQVDILLNTEDEIINAVEGIILFPENLLEIKDIMDGSSLINLWIEKPRIISPGQIIFSGITPGGYGGKAGLILSLIFKAKQTGQGIIELSKIKALKNDGSGTPASTAVFGLSFRVSEGASAVPAPKLEDIDPPEEFQLVISHDQNIFNNKWFLVFATQDKSSGIAGYFIQESTRKKDTTRIDAKKWISAESPYLLKNQNLRSYIYIKAIDKAGNERIEVIPPKYSPPWYEKYLLWVIIIAILVTIIIAAVYKSSNLKVKIQKSK